jgi:hypothetical protein
VDKLVYPVRQAEDSNFHNKISPPASRFFPAGTPFVSSIHDQIQEEADATFMNTIADTNAQQKAASDQTILQINRLNYIKVNAKILDSTNERLKKYLRFAADQMRTEVTSGDVVDFALNMLFDRDPGFRSWHKQQT